MASHIGLAAFLLLISAIMLVRHRQLWQQTSAAKTEPLERDYLRRQYRRRMQSSSLIGIIGLLVLGGYWIEHVLIGLIYWLVVTGLVFWILILAFADMVSTRHYFSKQSHRYLLQRSRLEAQLASLRRRAGDGKDSDNGRSAK